MGEEGGFRWRDAVLCGVLWGVVVTLAVSLNQPVGDLNLPDFVKFMGCLVVTWSATGLVLSGGVKMAEQSRHPGLVLPCVLIAAWQINILFTLFLGNNSVPGNFGHLSIHQPISDLSFYLLWSNLFYGGLYALGYFATRRTLRLRRRLAALRLARSDAEAKLREARLQAVRGQIQPIMLLDALQALGRAYARDRGAGDTLFDLLVAFLRAAMPGLRSGSSTLAAELNVLNRYADLRRALETGEPFWRLDLAEPPAELAFPPLRLLPALDRLSRTAPPEATVEVSAQAAADAFVVRIGAPTPRPLPVLALQHLRSAMRQDLGVGAMMRTDPPPPLIAELHVPDAPQGAAA